MPTAFVTGITGQTGSYLCEALLAEGWRVIGLVRRPDELEAELRERSPEAELVVGDLADTDALSRLLGDMRPDYVFNLGGVSSVARSWEDPVGTALATGLGAASLLAAAWSLQRDLGRPVGVVQATSAEIFGDPVSHPQDESTAVHPINPYGAAKAWVHHLVGVYRRAGLPASSCILYNHESPRRPESFVTRKITSGVAKIALGLENELVLGNLDARRDWGWAPDYARALALAARSPDDYVIATGESHSVREFVAAAFAAAGIDDWSDLVRQDQAFVRPADASELVGDATRARVRLGWEPTLTFSEIVAAMVGHDIERLRGGPGVTG